MSDDLSPFTLDFVRDVLKGMETEDGLRADAGPFLSYAFAAAAEGKASFSAADLLLAIRSSYGRRIERISVISLMRSLKGSVSVFDSVGRSLWEIHENACVDAEECSLHSLGSLWGMSRLGCDCSRGDWFCGAIETLLAGHPLRRWSLHIPQSLRAWMVQGWLSKTEELSILKAAIDSGAHEYWTNSQYLQDWWRESLERLTPEELNERLTIGNRLVAAGLTSLIDPQLEKLE